MQTLDEAIAILKKLGYEVSYAYDAIRRCWELTLYDNTSKTTISDLLTEKEMGNAAFVIKKLGQLKYESNGKLKQAKVETYRNLDSPLNYL